MHAYLLQQCSLASASHYAPVSPCAPPAVPIAAAWLLPGALPTGSGGSRKSRAESPARGTKTTSDGVRRSTRKRTPASSFEPGFD